MRVSAADGLLVDAGTGVVVRYGAASAGAPAGDSTTWTAGVGGGVAAGTHPMVMATNRMISIISSVRQRARRRFERQCVRSRWVVCCPVCVFLSS